jgi:hypothetical protein
MAGLVPAIHVYGGNFRLAERAAQFPNVMRLTSRARLRV